MYAEHGTVKLGVVTRWSFSLELPALGRLGEHREHTVGDVDGNNVRRGLKPFAIHELWLALDSLVAIR